MRTNRYYPRSFTLLVIIAMGVLIVPLASGLINAVRVLQGVADTQRQFALTSLAITRDVRQVGESVGQLQRAAGQYHLLQDPEFGPTLRARHAELQALLERLSGPLANTPAHAQVVSLQRQGEALFAAIRPGDFLDSARFHAQASAFDQLHATARILLVEADAAVRREQQALEATLKATRQRLIWLTLALIPLTLLLAGVFSWLINRPIRQIKSAIQQLGRADLSPLPRIAGPHDLVELGRELDWLRQRLQALEEQKLRFLRHVSHELKTPLASLREGVALLDDELAGSLNVRQRSIVAIMDAGSRDLQQRIEDLIRYGGMVRDGARAPATSLRLAEVLDAVLARQKLSLAARNVRIETALGAASVMADRTQLETVLDNLLSNAVKFSPEGGRILVKSEADDDAVRLSVCDEGPGIPGDERARVFEPFFQGARQPASTIKGSGLGLSIVRETLRAAGGTAEIVHCPPWSTCVRLTWPSPAASLE